MPMDDYDFPVSKYERTIDIYVNDNVDEILSNLNVEFSENFVQQFKQKVELLKNALRVLDPRTVVNIGAKIVNYLLENSEDKVNRKYVTHWYLIQVHHWHRPCEYTKSTNLVDDDDY